MVEIKKGCASLRAELERNIEDRWRTREELEKRLQWVLDRADMYAKKCHTDRETVLAAWEEDRDYWWLNYYQERKQPDLSKVDVMTLDEWEADGKRRFGEDFLDWKFKCPACGYVQTPRQFKESGIEPEKAYFNCASRYDIGGKKICKWTTGGLLNLGGRYVVDKKYIPRLIFDFAD